MTLSSQKKQPCRRWEPGNLTYWPSIHKGISFIGSGCMTEPYRKNTVAQLFLQGLVLPGLMQCPASRRGEQCIHTERAGAENCRRPGRNAAARHHGNTIAALSWPKTIKYKCLVPSPFILQGKTTPCRFIWPLVNFKLLDLDTYSHTLTIANLTKSKIKRRSPGLDKQNL